MTDDLISREALKKSMRKSMNERYISWTKTITVADIATLIFDEIEYAPTVDIKPFAIVKFDKDELDRIVDERIIEPIKNGELVVKKEIPQDEFTIDELEKWLYAIAQHNDNDLGQACLDIVGRLDGFENFVADTRGDRQ